jgi:RNA polymerase sporulation-specific sigma factor
VQNENEAINSRCDEAKLIEAAKNGDERAFESLVKIYKRILEYHIRQIDPNGINHDDLFQEGLIGLLKAVRSYDGKSASFAISKICTFFHRKTGVLFSGRVKIPLRK